MTATSAGAPRNDLAYRIVNTIVSRSVAGATVSTRDAIVACRAEAPDCALTDEELVRLLVAEAIGRSRSVEFDHR
jgi:hypothetical protein